MRKLKARQLLLEGLLAAGVRNLFGNPGTTEMPLLDGLSDYPQLSYYLALHEAVAVGMADGYALASGTLGVVNLHVAPGLGNGLGMVYNAWEGGSPLLITAGQQDTRMRLRAPFLSHDLVAMAAPLTKLSAQVEQADDLPLLLHRCLKVAQDAPSGPVFLSLPINVMEETASRPPMPPPQAIAGGQPETEAVVTAAEMLLDAKQPVIVCGDAVARTAAQGELVALAEVLGAPVWNTLLPARLNFPMTHPHYRGELPGDARRIQQALGSADVVLLVGGPFFKEVWHAAGSPLPAGVEVIEIQPTASSLERNIPITLGIAADVRSTLEALHLEVISAARAPFHAEAAARKADQLACQQAERKRQDERLRKNWNRQPMSTARAMWEIVQALPEGTSVVSEAITAGADLMRSLPLEDPRGFYGSRGGGIGQGLPTALGVQVAYPDRPVLCVSGDGSSLYSIQALWTAAHHNLPVVFVILNNAVYRILKINLDRYRAEFGLSGERGYPHMDLTDPRMDFVQMAKGFGVPAKRIESPDKLAAAVRGAFRSAGPYLIDLVVAGEWPGQ